MVLGQCLQPVTVTGSRCGCAPAHLSQECPVLWSRQPMQRPVSGSHSSVCPLQKQGRHVGKPQWPGRQRSHCRPYSPGRQVHCPVSGSQKGPCEPWGSQSHAVDDTRHKTRSTGGSGQWDRLPRSRLDHRALTSAAVGPEMEGGWGARVAVPPDHVGATLALAAVWVTHGAERALRVTLALWETRGRTQREI